ncbi:hypothetical protein HCA73_10695 [Listeria booriae]|uniref:hypothetical protein n=1 Tax=Listeria booriae TaxID=1552123 RepID=UPI001626E87D|nr:hypothetical protein [Listeria booriae]MBC1913118.1 hypothetical protein [Listeria booriae]
MLNEFKFIKHAKNFVDKTKAIKALTGIYYAEDGSLACSNNCVLVILKDVHNRQEVIIDPSTGEVIDSDFPDVQKTLSSVAQQQDEQLVIKNDTNLRCFIDSLEFLNKTTKTNNKAVMLKISNKAKTITINRLSNKNEKDPFFTICMPFEGEVKDATLHFNVRYLLDVFKLLAVNKEEDVLVEFGGIFVPMSLTAGNAFTLVTPLKVW